MNARLLTVASLALGLLAAACTEVASLALGLLAVACMELCGRQSQNLRHRNPLYRQIFDRQSYPVASN